MSSSFGNVLLLHVSATETLLSKLHLRLQQLKFGFKKSQSGVACVRWTRFIGVVLFFTFPFHPPAEIRSGDDDADS